MFFVGSNLFERGAIVTLEVILDLCVRINSHLQKA